MIYLVETNQLYIRSIITAEPEWVFREGKCQNHKTTYILDGSKYTIIKDE